MTTYFRYTIRSEDEVIHQANYPMDTSIELDATHAFNDFFWNNIHYLSSLGLLTSWGHEFSIMLTGGYTYHIVVKKIEGGYEFTAPIGLKLPWSNEHE